MPGRDKSGPTGNGSMTGRGMGICTGAEDQGPYQNIRFGRRMRAAARGGFGRGFNWRAEGKQLNVNVPTAEIDNLRNEIKLLKEQISFLEKNIHPKT